MIEGKIIDSLGNNLQILLDVPSNMSDKKLPLTISLQGEKYPQLACLSYSIKFRNDEIVASYLIDTDNNEIKELSRLLGRLMVKKIGNPTYVIIDHAVGQLDFFTKTNMVKEIISFVIKNIDYKTLNREASFNYTEHIKS